MKDKKLVIFYAGAWAEQLLTVARAKKVAYFVDDDHVGEVFSGGDRCPFNSNALAGAP